ncbi:hypothetical protein SAMN05660297_02624 [Natronincola peptidivorans]|uniref:Uncharacterized protein n=1 Tax=Natronincola peptidivorans TaxID=426128 RepID=A0A1I0EYA2_9FIRM|nr:hypothetical protein [Natronincola peptidivorans]SET50645.1 hypothetical protein SAMN05660297_02624 [Natronincola peptidivorans]
MEIIKDIFYTNRKVTKNAIESLYKNWIIIFTGLFYSIAIIILSMLLPHFWILAGLVHIIFSSALVSNYLYLISCIIRKNKFGLQDFKDGFTVYLRKVWGVMFIAWVASLIFNTFLTPFFRGMAIGLIINVVVLIVLNAIPEVIYQKHYNPWETITYTVEFVKDNWIEWFAPNLILLGVLYFLTGSLLTGIYFFLQSLRIIFQSPIGLILFILGQVWLSFTMIYRGYLFEILSTSNRRKRLFMREF